MFRTVNATDNRVWITAYSAFGRHTDYGWCEANSSRDWTGGGPVKIRGEVKADAAGSDPNIYDTDCEGNFEGTAWRIVKGDGNYYWEFVQFL